MARDFENGDADELTHASVYDPSAGGAISVAAWINPETLSTATPMYLFNIQDTVNLTGFAYIFSFSQVNNGGNSMRRVNTLSGIYLGRDSAAATFSTGTWAHVCYTDDGTTSDVTTAMHIYKDGVEVSYAVNTSVTGTETTMGGTNVIGGRTTDTLRGWDGLMGEFAVWNRALTTTEVTMLGAAKVVPLCIPRGLIFYLPMIGPPDYLRDTRNGTLWNETNATAAAAHPRVYRPATWYAMQYGAAAAASGQPYSKRLGGIPFMGRGAPQSNLGIRRY